MIEFRRSDKNTWQPFPVEHKHGKPKAGPCDKIQLCAQALCLEEMLAVHISDGALFYGRTRRRLDVSFGESLRRETEDAAERAHRLISSGVTPPPVYGKRCDSCSLIGECLPKKMEKRSSVKGYLARMAKTDSP
ncbi:MAG: CRISPR-associated protein Cas4 [Syntrophorhabdales bacterium]